MPGAYDNITPFACRSDKFVADRCELVVVLEQYVLA